MPSLHSWRAAEFLYDIVSRWGKPRFVRTDNGSDYGASFEKLCKGLGIVHHKISIGNSKANGQVERIFRVIKTVIRKGLAEDE